MIRTLSLQRLCLLSAPFAQQHSFPSNLTDTSLEHFNIEVCTLESDTWVFKILVQQIYWTKISISLIWQSIIQVSVQKPKSIKGAGTLGPFLLEWASQGLRQCLVSELWLVCTHPWCCESESGLLRQCWEENSGTWGTSKCKSKSLLRCSNVPDTNWVKKPKDSH